MMNPFFSIIIPVFNETDTIHQLLRHLDEISAGYDPQIIIVDGNPAGNTIQAIDESEWRMPVRKRLSPKGRGIQMNTGTACADGRILLFLHADTRLYPNALQDIESVIRSETEVVGGAFDLGIDSSRLLFRVIERVSSFRSRMTRIPYGDQAIFMKSGYFRKIGCFSTFPIMEDVDLMLRVRRSGGKLRILPEKVRTSSRRWEKEGILLCTFRNWLLIMLFFCGVSPARLEKYYS